MKYILSECLLKCTKGDLCPFNVIWKWMCFFLSILLSTLSSLRFAWKVTTPRKACCACHQDRYVWTTTFRRQICHWLKFPEFIQNARHHRPANIKTVTDRLTEHVVGVSRARTHWGRRTSWKWSRSRATPSPWWCSAACSTTPGSCSTWKPSPGPAIRRSDQSIQLNNIRIAVKKRAEHTIVSFALQSTEDLCRLNTCSWVHDRVIGWYGHLLPCYWRACPFACFNWT